jgi:hypothetical protein
VAPSCARHPIDRPAVRLTIATKRKLHFMLRYTRNISAHACCLPYHDPQYLATTLCPGENGISGRGDPVQFRRLAVIQSISAGHTGAVYRHAQNVGGETIQEFSFHDRGWDRRIVAGT